MDLITRSVHFHRNKTLGTFEGTLEMFDKVAVKDGQPLFRLVRFTQTIPAISLLSPIVWMSQPLMTGITSVFRVRWG